ncbi:hypothetical protein BDK51DRAFT_41262 [Blyttiomyces helicus]|uniref:Uncharacterized protein n=1 Tax=Blyttiomyces helicus TaxID=388810 RepID=A0A4P9WCC7_9FUNG|nr:hypothetical protein BDK51DRAFT_41262 [Blyttiomyces helicus]|eukprot:RKO90309.1 hypothetical protein BDK51DRAFT_41262 [Blyttiomyces helicus]
MPRSTLWSGPSASPASARSLQSADQILAHAGRWRRLTDDPLRSPPSSGRPSTSPQHRGDQVILEGIRRLSGSNGVASAGRGRQQRNRTAPDRMVTDRQRRGPDRNKLPNLKLLRYTRRWLAADLAVIAAGYSHLVVVNLAYGGREVTDVGVSELDLFATSITPITLVTLKSHRPLALLAIGGKPLSRTTHRRHREGPRSARHVPPQAPLGRPRVGPKCSHRVHPPGRGEESEPIAYRWGRAFAVFLRLAL